MTNTTLEQPSLLNFLRAFNCCLDTEKADIAAELLKNFGFDINAVARLDTHCTEAKLIAAFAEYLIQTNNIALPNWSFDQWSLEYSANHLTVFGLISLAQDLAAQDRFSLKIKAETKGVVIDIEDAEFSASSHHFAGIMLQVAGEQAEINQLKTMADYNAFLKQITPTGVFCLKREVTEVLTQNHDLSFCILRGLPYSE